jgi:hypothetical protein
MKKLTIMLAMLSIAATTVLTSCGDDEEAEDAKVSLVLRRVSTNGDTTVNFNSGGSAFTGNRIIVEARFEGNNDNKLKSYNMVGAWTGATAKTGSLSGTSASIFDTILVSLDPGTYSYVATLTSEKGNVTQSFSFTIPTTGGGGGGNNNYLVKKAVVQLGNQSANPGSFWTSNGDSVYTITMLNAVANRRSNVDVIFYSNATASVSSVGSPRAPGAKTAFTNVFGANDANWTAVNQRDTRFWTTTFITNTEFNAAIDSAGIDALIARAFTDPSIPGSGIPNQAVDVLPDRLILVQFANGRRGIMQVAGVNTGSGNARTLDAFILFQQQR